MLNASSDPDLTEEQRKRMCEAEVRRAIFQRRYEALSEPWRLHSGDQGDWHARWAHSSPPSSATKHQRPATANLLHREPPRLASCATQAGKLADNAVSQYPSSGASPPPSRSLVHCSQSLESLRSRAQGRDGARSWERPSMLAHGSPTREGLGGRGGGAARRASQIAARINPTLCEALSLCKSLEERRLLLERCTGEVAAHLKPARPAVSAHTRRVRSRVAPFFDARSQPRHQPPPHLLHHRRGGAYLTANTSARSGHRRCHALGPLCNLYGL